MPERIYIEDPEEIELNQHDEIQELLGHPPGWMLKWGITVVLLFVGLFLLLSWIIKYPDTNTAAVTITTVLPPVSVVAASSGELSELLVKDQQMLKEGELIGIVNSGASYDDIRTMLNEFDKLGPKNYAAAKLPRSLSLGVLNTEYVALIQAIESFQHFQSKTTSPQKINSLEEELLSIERMNEYLKSQEDLFRNELALTEKNYQRNLELKQDQIVSEVELERIHSQLLQQQQQISNFKTSRINNEVKKEQIQTQISSVENDYQLEESTQMLKIQQQIDRIRGDVKQWEEKYLFKSPADGQISFSQVWSRNQYIKSGEEIFKIVPTQESGEIIARCELPVAGAGKVKKGSTASIRLDAFPYQEYGSIPTQVDKISLIPNMIGEGEFAYQLELNLPQNLISSYGRELPFRQQMKGTAIIITEDKRIFHRVFEKLYSVINN